MTHWHDTGYGWIELQAERGGLLRTANNFPHDAPTMQISVRTWQVKGRHDWKGAIPAKSPRCILKLNDALDEFSKILPPCVMVLMLDEPSTTFQKLNSSWIRFKTGAIRKSDTLSEDRWLNYLEEFYAVQ